MTTEEKIENIRLAIGNRSEIDTLSGSESILFHPYLLYQDMINKRYFCYGYYADTNVSVEPKTFSLDMVDAVEETEDNFIVKPFWKSNEQYSNLHKLQLKCIAEIPIDISE